MPNDPTNADQSCRLLYDGECPMCSAFAHVVAKEESGHLTKINARETGSLRNQATAAGMDLDYGIVVEQQGRLYYGHEALHCLASRDHQSFALGLLYLPFRSRKLAEWIYPLLVKIRRLILWLGRKPLINNLPSKSV